MKEEEPEENSGTKAYLSLLPPELVLQIMSHLSLGDCYSLSVTARFAQAVFDNELLWKRLCWTHFKIRLDLDHSGRAKDFYRHVLKPYARFIGVWQRDQSVTYFGSLHQMVYCDWALYFLQWFPPRVPDVEQALRKYHMFKIRLDPTLSRAQIEVIDPFYSNGIVGIVPAKPSPTPPSHFQFLIDHLEDFTLEPDLWSENLERFIFLDKGAPYDKRSFVDEMRMVKFMTFCHNRPSHRYNRLQFQSPPQFDVPIKPGLFKGTYGSHGIEMIELKYPSETEYQAVKVTGDPNVPCNEITFKASNSI